MASNDNLTVIEPDQDWLVRALHSLLMALPAEISLPDGQKIRFSRETHPDAPSPLVTDPDTMEPAIALDYRTANFRTAFTIRQVGAFRVNEKLPRDQVLPSAPDPLKQ